MTVQLLCAIFATGVLWKLSEREISASMTSGFEENGRIVAESIAKSVELNLASRDVTAVQAALDASLATPDVKWAYVTAPDGRVIADTFVPLFPDYLPRNGPATGSVLIHVPGSNKPVMMFNQPVMAGIFGAVHVGIDQERMLRSIVQVRRFLLVTMGVVFAMLGGIVSFLTHRTIAPIRALTQASSAMANDLSGEFVALPIRSDNELGTLTAAFNRMMAERQLDRKNLEARVLQRTEELVKANAELDLARSRAEAATTAKSDFLSTMSHEIRTPMNGVLGMTNLLLETRLTHEQLDYAQTVRSSGEALLSIINDILDFSKMEAGKMTIEPIPFDLAVAVEDVIELLGCRSAEKGLDLILRYCPETPRRVIGDPGRIRQILLNLAGNAIKFTKRGHVLITIECKDAQADPPVFHFSVEDTGIGIAPDKLPMLFDKFTQADTSTTRTYGGTGLGLAISRQLAELMGGELTATSRLNKGSTFSFSLPLPLDHTEPEVRSYCASLRGARVLVVDDNPLNLRIVAEQLAGGEGEIVCVPSAAAALTALASAHQRGSDYHMAILDHLMPDMDGEMLGRQMKADPRFSSISLLMLTSSAQKSDRARFEAVGFAAYLTKPARAALLEEALLAMWSAIVEGRPLTGMITRHSLAEARVHRPEEQVQKHDRAGSSAPRVLVAEDNPVNQKLARRLLEKAGCQVDVSANGAEAVQMWCQFPYDLIFMDCQMPEMDGYEATAEIRRLEKLKATYSHTPIVALTANAMTGDREKCLAAGMDDFIAKPIPIDAVNRVIRRWTEAAAEQAEQLVKLV
jgi:signal transduction histidine kinase/DNA-binding response OmpR family regulator